jgi:hypothetical protein
VKSFVPINSKDNLLLISAGKLLVNDNKAFKETSVGF